MSNTASLLIENAMVVRPGASTRGWILVQGDKIAETGTGDTPAAVRLRATETVDALGALLMPALTDSHVHFREPGLTSKATIASESRAAVRGGIAAVFDMPNTIPPTTTAQALADKLALGRASASTRFAAFIGATAGCMEQLSLIDPATIPGVKLFLGTTTGAMGMPSDAEMASLFDFCADHRLPIVVHAEDNGIIARNTAEAIARHGGNPADVPVSEHHRIRSAEACLASSRMAVEMAIRHNTRLHIAHISTAAEVAELLSPGPVAGKLITAETTPMYLDPVLADEAMRSGLHKINPAIKTPADAEALRQALATGAVDTIATDHAPHLPADKLGGALTAASGAPSLQFALPLMLTYLSPETIVEKMAAAPAEIFGMQASGAIRPGDRADLIIVRPVGPYRITTDMVESSCGWTPFEGRTLHHRVDSLWIAGERILANGTLTSTRPSSTTITFAH